MVEATAEGCTGIPTATGQSDFERICRLRRLIFHFLLQPPWYGTGNGDRWRFARSECLFLSTEPRRYGH